MRHRRRALLPRRSRVLVADFCFRPAYRGSSHPAGRLVERQCSSDRRSRERCCSSSVAAVTSASAGASAARKSSSAAASAEGPRPPLKRGTELGTPALLALR
jgi:hypothetical protein